MIVYKVPPIGHEPKFFLNIWMALEEIKDYLSDFEKLEIAVYLYNAIRRRYD